MVRSARLAPCGARLPACWAAPTTTYPERVVILARSRCRTTEAGRLTHKLGVARPGGARTGGALPPPVTGRGRPEKRGRFSAWWLPRPLARPAGAGAACRCCVLDGLASLPVRCARSAGATKVARGYGIVSNDCKAINSAIPIGNGYN